MKILVYECFEAPPKLRYLAVYIQDGEMQPVRHVGPDMVAVTRQAQEFWDTEAAKRAAPKKVRGKKAAQVVVDEPAEEAI